MSTARRWSAPPLGPLAVIGVGQIGGSVALAARTAGAVGEVAAYSRNPATLGRAQALGIIDRAASSAADAVRGAGLVVLATPVGSLGAVAREIAPALAPGAIVLDVGSVKAGAIRAVEAELPAGTFVPCHPLAGTERFGPDAASPLLFEGRRCVICPTAASREETVALVERLWAAMGAEPVRMDAALHDRVLAAGSHLPHLTAYALAGVLGRLGPDQVEAVKRLPTTSLRDTTRVAASSPVMWRDILLDNREEVLPLLSMLGAEIEALRAAIDAGDAGRIEALLAAGKAGRDRIIRAGASDRGGDPERVPVPPRDGLRRAKLAYARRDRGGDPERVPVPPRDGLRRAKLAYARRDRGGDPERVPVPPRDGLRRAKLAYARRDLRALSLAFALACGVLGCATSTTPAAVTAASAARTAPDDSDLWNLAPAGAVSIADVDLAALGRSPWSRALVQGGLGEEQAERSKAFGYDLFADVDRMLVVGAEAGPGGATDALTVARGRFDAARLAAAFTASTPGAVAERWRESPLWEGSGRAVGLVTPRTLVQGTPEAVRGAIDAAWGVVPDARGGTLGELRRVLDAERAGSAVTLAVVVTDEVRARAAGFLEIPPGLRRLGARLDLGRDLDLDVRAVLDGGPAATSAADLWGTALAELGRQRLLRVLGLGPLIKGVTLRVAGSQVHGHLHVAEDQREALSQRLTFLLETLIKQRRAAAATATP